MRNDIASFEKTSRSKVKIIENINAEFIFALNFAQNLTSLLLVFSKEAILFLIYLLADKAKWLGYAYHLFANIRCSSTKWIVCYSQTKRWRTIVRQIQQFWFQIARLFLKNQLICQPDKFHEMQQKNEYKIRKMWNKLEL